jgi:predicted Zn finger-like uncharacterized protein
MTVQCPHCSTQYRVTQAQLQGADPVFKCTKCGQLFEPGERRRQARNRRKANEDPPNLSFDFEKEEEESREEPAFVDGLMDAEDEEEARDDFEGEDLLEDEDPPFEDSDESDELEDDEPEEAVGRARGAEDWIDDGIEDEDEDEDEDDWEEEEEQLPPHPPVRRRPVPAKRRATAPRADPRKSPLKPVGWSVAIILLGYLLVAITFDRRPEIAVDSLTRIPVLGKLLGQDHLLAYQVRLDGITGGLDQIKGNRLAYVVTGRAINDSTENLRLIEIEGELIAGGKTRAVRKVYAANQAKGTIRDLSINEVDMLLRLEPNRRFLIPPGESASFLLVFPDPPADTSDVVCRVIEARTS